MTEVFCTDCGSECTLIDGAEIDPKDRALAGIRHWRCSACPDSYARHIEATGGPGEPPSGGATKAARTHLQRRRIEPLIEQALRRDPGTRALAQGRIVAWIASRLGLSGEAASLGWMGIGQLREAWAMLGRTSYEEIRTTATTKQRKAA